MEVSMSIFHCHGPFGTPMALSTRRMGFYGNPPILEPAAAGNPPKNIVESVFIIVKFDVPK